MKKFRANKEYKLIHIIIGLAIGFFMGAVVVYFGFNRQNVSVFNSQINTPVLSELIFPEVYNKSAPTSTETKTTNKNEISNKKPHNKQNKISQINTKQEDTISLVKSQPDSLDTNTETIQQIKIPEEEHPSQSEQINPNTKREDPEIGDVNVAKDNLVHITTLPNPKNNKQLTSSYPELDYMLGKNKLTSDNNTLQIEFWESPLNTKVYKKGKNKIVLYGISLYDFVSLKYYDDTIYLKYLNQFYPLEFTSEYKQLKPLSDLELIEQLQQL